jgi:hypothetical protein
VEDKNIMSCSHEVGIIVVYPLRLNDLQPVETNCGLPTGDKESQWKKIQNVNRANNQ